MSVQFLTNSKGEKTSVLVSLKEWDALNKQQAELKKRLEEAELKLIYKNAIEDANLFKEGKLKTYPVSELFDEL